MFKRGSYVKCIDARGTNYMLDEGKYYIVDGSNEKVTRVKTISGNFAFDNRCFQSDDNLSDETTNPLLEILDKTFASARQLIIEKGGEYAADTDVLANFRHEGEKLGLPMEVIWHVYIGKHLSAIDRYVRDIKDGKTDRPRMETLESRADDIITYMIHFKMMLKERNK